MAPGDLDRCGGLSNVGEHTWSQAVLLDHCNVFLNR